MVRFHMGTNFLGLSGVDEAPEPEAGNDADWRVLVPLEPA